ncbi:MAG: Abi family protein [Clostridia bacterium]|nr:Abi family protein [Clostridia bacterium]
MSEVKKFLCYEEQIEHLKSVGLTIEEDSVAKEILSKVNYYRLINAYSLGLYSSRNPEDRYIEGVTFYQLYDLYQFDSELRQVLSVLLENFEILFRTKLAYYIGEKYGALGYLSPEIFKNDEYHTQFLEDLEREKTHQSKSPIIEHHNEHYEGQLPIWVLVEIASFGMISKMYSNLNDEDQKNLAKEFNVKAYYLKNWLRSFVEIRNVCAHYGRLYNKVLTFPPPLFRDMNFDNTRVFSVLYILTRFADDKLWLRQVLKLKVSFEEHKSVELHKVGFPEDWEKLWS